MEGADLLSAVPAGLLETMGAGGIVIVTILGILRGWLVPARSVEKLLIVQNERLLQAEKRGDEWKAAYEASGERNAELMKQVAALQEVGRSQLGMIEGMKTAVEQRGRGPR